MRIDEKGKIAMSAIVITGLLVLVVGYFVYERTYAPQSGVMISPRMTVKYTDGTEETITPSLLLSVFYNSKPINRIYTFWDVTATVEGKTGTVDYTYSVWAQIGSSKMHMKDDTDLGIVLGTTHTLGYSSWVNSTEIQNTVGEGTHTLYFKANGTATSTVDGEALSKAFSAEVTANITVQNNMLEIVIVPKGITSG